MRGLGWGLSRARPGEEARGLKMELCTWMKGVAGGTFLGNATPRTAGFSELSRREGTESSIRKGPCGKVDVEVAALMSSLGGDPQGCGTQSDVWKRESTYRAGGLQVPTI